MTTVNVFTFIGAAVMGLIAVTIMAMAISLFSDLLRYLRIRRL